MSDRLRQRIIQRIRANGPITFAEYMGLALYDPSEGFFAGSPVGDRAHFVTSPHVSPVFATLMAGQLAEVWASLGRPSSFTVIEVGAADGTLAAGIREAAAGTEWAPALDYRCVEQSPVARGAIGSRGFEAFPTLVEAAPEPIVGCVIANELLDNLPFHRVRARGGALLEVYVDERADQLIEVDAPATEAAVSALGVQPAEEREQPSSPAAQTFVTACARLLARGFLLLIDYGFTAGEDPGPVRGYRGQRLVIDLLAHPGSADITGPVDLEAVAATARAAGLSVWGPVTQREALLGLGYRRALDVLRERQSELERLGAWRESVALWNQRGEAAMLVDPGGLGGLKVLAAGTEGLAPLRAVRQG